MVTQLTKSVQLNYGLAPLWAHLDVLFRIVAFQIALLMSNIRCVNSESGNMRHLNGT